MAKKKVLKHIQKKWLKVLQFFAAYLVAAWTILQFVDWIINRYQISPYWVDLWLWFFVGIIPSLLIYLYHQERINKRILHLREKIIFPLNVVIIAVGLYLGYGTSDLGATTKEIEFTNEDGTIVRKLITKDEFRIGIPIFNFKQTSKDSTTMWLERGIRDLLYYDMHQDKNVNPDRFFADNTIDKVQDTKVYYKFYVDGTYKVIDGFYTVNPNLRQSSNGKLIASRSFTGTEVFKILDSISIYIREQVGVTDKQLAQYVDLDIQEFTSDSFKAIQHFVLGDYDKAIAIDSTFALAYLYQARTNINYSQGKYEERYNIDKAFLNRSKLPTDRQLQILIYKYIAYEDWGKAEKLVNIQLEIEPNNEVYTNLLYLIYSETKQIKAYLNYAKSKFDKEDSAYNAERYAEALLINGDYQFYIDYVDNLMRINPEDKDIFLFNLAPQILKGDLNEARKILGKATILRPDWENINKVYDSTLSYLERNPKSKIDLTFFVGEFRYLESEQEYKFWINNDVLLFYASNQRISAIIPSGKTKLTIVFNPANGILASDYLQDNGGKTYAIQFEQYNMESSWKYLGFKLDKSIRKAEALLAKGDLVNAEITYNEAIANNPKHFYLKDALAHIKYMKEIDSVTLQKQYKDIIGTYGERKVSLENGRLIYKRGRNARRELLPISKTRYINMLELTTNFEFDYQKDKVIGSFYWSFDLEKMEWIKKDAEDQYLNKD